MTAIPPSPVSPTEWIRIFASKLAQRRPNICAEEVLSLAIDQFKRSHALPPELAAARLEATGGDTEPRAGG